MQSTRRSFLQISSLGLINLSVIKSSEVFASNNKNRISEAPLIQNEERVERIKKAQNLLRQNKMVALVLDAGTNMEYFSGIHWNPSERSMLAIIPANGEITYICPSFEEDEHENPFKLVIQIFKKLGFQQGQIAIEEQTRFFISDGIKKAGKAFKIVSGDPITIPCRLIKSKNEIALMQKANDMTAIAIQYGLTFLSEGITPSSISQKIAAKHVELGGQHRFASVTFGVASSFPHGSSRKQILKKGDIVMLDCGCSYGGYESDITRTVIFGPASEQKIKIWELEKRAQAAGFAAAKLGDPCENVDFAARKVIIDAGYGPGYKLPGLPHRTGHGIGMNGHEWGNMVKGNKLKLQVGMCFSIEPTIAIPNEFGVRIEDCVYMTENGPKWFSKPSPSIDQPFELS
jgi:Xaa-Pro dipeptidase